MTLRTVLVDDEPLARARLRALLEREPDVQIVGHSGDGTDAVETIERLAPDLVLLDVAMPGLDGFGVLAELARREAVPPAVVFVTAHDEHALRAFDVHAVDYVLKPLVPERLAEAVAQARARRPAGVTPGRPAGVGAATAGADAPDWAALLAALRGDAPRYLDRVAVRVGDRIAYVRLADVDWVEADGNYVRLHTPGRAHLLRRALGSLAEALDPRQFARIHRSAVVNIDRIAELRPLPDGDHTVVLTTGVKLRLSRRHRDALPPF